jgi:prepilin-type N-terminal cleavage/methylation domain-containing protein
MGLRVAKVKRLISRIRQRDNSAFTILEMLVVLMIISLVATGANFRISNAFDRIALARAETWLDSTLVELRRDSRREGRPRTVLIDPRTGRYRISDAEWRSLPPDVAWSFEDVSGQAALTPSVTFLPDGSTSGATILVHAGALAAMRRVDQLSGTIHHVAR